MSNRYDYTIKIETKEDNVAYFLELKKLIKLASKKTKITYVHCKTSFEDILLDKNKTLEFLISSRGKEIPLKDLKAMFEKYKGNGIIKKIDDFNLKEYTIKILDGVSVELDIEPLEDDWYLPF